MSTHAGCFENLRTGFAKRCPNIDQTAKAFTIGQQAKEVDKDGKCSKDSLLGWLFVASQALAYAEYGDRHFPHLAHHLSAPVHSIYHSCYRLHLALLILESMLRFIMKLAVAGQ